jgi:putative phosphoesterase
MRKLGIISDVHADPIALELAWAHLIVLGAERVVCAGDVVGYGTAPDRLVGLLRKLDIPSVRGNHDRWALERGPGEPDEFGGAVPSRPTLDYLAGLPFRREFRCGERVVSVVHASPRDDMEYVTRSNTTPAQLDAWLEAAGADVLVVGHTHSPMWYRGPRGLVLNPGSVVSVPVVRTSRSFALLDLDALAASFHDVESGRALDVRPWFEPEPAP